MIRHLIAPLALALTAVPSLALAAIPPGGVVVEPPRQLDAPGAVVVRVQPRDRYVVILDARGKDEITMSREIQQAAYIACLRSPRSGNALDARPSVMQMCHANAIFGARAQLRRILEARVERAAAAQAGG
jgi:hypothetical protein